MATITDKSKLRAVRMAKRMYFLRRSHKLLYAAYRNIGEGELRILLMAAASRNNKLTSESIFKEVAEYIGLDMNELRKKTRKREIVETRQVAMYLSKRDTKESLATIGRNIGNKNHATVLHAAKTINNLIATNQEFRDKWMPLIINER